MAFRSRYWSCSKFADWLRGTKKLYAGTGKEWDEWDEKAKAAHSFRYWLAEEGLDKIQTVIMWPIDQLYNIKYWINNRFVTKTHALTSNLKKGQWHELDTRIMHCLFDELVNHVEIELAASNFRWDEEARNKYKTPFWAIGWFRWRSYRNVEAAMDYLEWASNLRWSEDEVGEDDPAVGKLTYQAEGAREIRELYLWWKNVYPNRPDPMDVSGWSEFCDRRREDREGGVLSWLEDKTPEEAEESRQILDRCRELEEQYDNEDTEMLIRLIKVRQRLWT
jgi:hypothetical protein